MHDYYCNQSINKVITTNRPWIDGVMKMQANLRQIRFSVEKIKTVVNVGRCSAYQIFATPGEVIGTLGNLELTGTATNQPVFNTRRRTTATR